MPLEIRHYITGRWVDMIIPTALRSGQLIRDSENRIVKVVVGVTRAHDGAVEIWTVKPGLISIKAKA